MLCCVFFSYLADCSMLSKALGISTPALVTYLPWSSCLLSRDATKEEGRMISLMLGMASPSSWLSEEKLVLLWRYGAASGFSSKVKEEQLLSQGALTSNQHCFARRPFWLFCTGRSPEPQFGLVVSLFQTSPSLTAFKFNLKWPPLDKGNENQLDLRAPCINIFNF